jgi:hypothetical protein
MQSFIKRGCFSVTRTNITYRKVLLCYTSIQEELEWENLAEAAQEGISAEAAEAAFEETLDRVKCTRQLALSAALNAKCHSSQQRASQSIAKNAI